MKVFLLLYFVSGFIMGLVYWYYMYRVEFVHQFILLHNPWWQRFRNSIGESEKKILETGNAALIKDYYRLKKVAGVLQIYRTVGLICVLIIITFSILFSK